MQSAFRDAMHRRGDGGIPEMIAVADGPDVATRLDVYRNNITSALVRSLEGLYPSLCALMGEPFFRQVARDFARAHPPPDGRLIGYGFGFPAFVAGYEAASGHPWFADVARLEAAWHRAYIAADAPALRLAELSPVAPEHMDAIRLALHPSCQWLESRYPASAIWRFGLGEIPADSPVDVESGPEWLMVVRPRSAVEVRALAEADYRFGRALADGRTLGEAWEAARAVDPDFALQDRLAGWFAGETFSGFRAPASQPEG